MWRRSLAWTRRCSRPHARTRRRRGRGGARIGCRRRRRGAQCRARGTGQLAVTIRRDRLRSIRAVDDLAAGDTARGNRDVRVDPDRADRARPARSPRVSDSAGLSVIIDGHDLDLGDPTVARSRRRAATIRFTNGTVPSEPPAGFVVYKVAAESASSATTPRCRASTRRLARRLGIADATAATSSAACPARARAARSCSVVFDSSYCWSIRSSYPQAVSTIRPWPWTSRRAGRLGGKGLTGTDELDAKTRG